MPLDTRIALTGQPLQLESPLAQYSQLMSVANAGAQNQLAQMQMSAAQRAMQEDEDVKNYLARSDVDLSTSEGQRGLLRLGKPGQAVLKSLSEQRKLQTEEDKNKYEFEIKTLDRAINDLTNLTDLPMAFASIDRQIAAKSITPQQGAELKTRINNAPDFSTWQNQTITGMLDAKERLGAMAEQRYQEFRGRPAPAAPTAAPAAPMAAPAAPVAPMAAPVSAVPLDKLTVSEDARGNKTYYLDGVPIPGEKFAELTAASAAPTPLSGTRAAFLASMAPAVAPAPAPMAPATPTPAAAPMAPAATPAAPAAAAPMAPAAPPDMANALALKIQGLQEERNKLRPFLASKSAKADFDDLGKQIENLSKGFSVSAGGAYFLPGVGMVERPLTSADVTAMKALGYPITQEGFKAYRDAQRQDRLLTPEEERQKIRIAAAGRAPAAPRAEPAPSVTNIVDPTNPNQMIAIDARRYRGGGVGSPGVIGASGKEPSAAVRTNKVEAGKTQLADDLENLRNAFDTLDNLRAIPSTERGKLSNIGSAIASSRVGQLTGQALATEAQVERDVINSARSRLVNSIKNATGMSAQQLNSNVELQTMLKSISDPGQSYQSAIRIIQDIEDAYVTGNGMLPKRDRPAAPQNVPAVNVDALLDKYK